MIIGSTLGRYLSLRFLNTIMAVFLPIFGMVYVFDFVELLRRSNGMPGVTPGFIAFLSLLRTPSVAEQILPFCVLFGTMAAFLDLTRKLELIVARAAGVSVWQFLVPPVAIALLIGILSVGAVQPALGGDEAARRRRSRRSFSAAAAAATAIRPCGSGKRASTAKPSCAPTESLKSGTLLTSVTAYVYEPDGRFEERVQAERATLLPGVWKLQNAEISAPGRGSARGRHLPARYRSFSRPTFGKLPYAGFRAVLGLAEAARGERAGRPRFHRFPASISNASGEAAAACRHGSDRRGLFVKIFPIWWNRQMVGGGIAAGFVLYLLTKMVADLGGSGLLSAPVAAWSPAVVGSMLGALALLHQEDG